MTLNSQDAMFLQIARDAVDAGFASYIQTMAVDTVNLHMENARTRACPVDKREKWHQLRDLWMLAHADMSRYFEDASWPDLRYTVVKDGD